MPLPVVREKGVSDLWWKNGLVVCVDVKAYLDADGDGIGDLSGLTARIEYLRSLGATCLWLLPIHPSPWRDDGYDITDFYGIDPRLGTLGDFVEVVRTAHGRGIRVVLDLVVNHTSDEHPWFQAARRDRDSPYRDWYVWADEPQAEPEGLVFPGEMTSNWEFDATAGQYYLHRFHAFQPDLNIANPHVQDEIRRIAGFWLDLGVSGFRLDAAPFIIESAGIRDPLKRDRHAYLRDLRAFVTRRRGDAILIGEVNEPPRSQGRFFGTDDEGDELAMLFNFVLNNALYLALVRERAEPLERYVKRLPKAPATGQWLNFARVHDELNLDRLTRAERREVFDALAPDDDMRIYGRGIRRRLAPMLGGDGPRLRLAYSLLFSLPGTPLLLWGDEIGQGDDLSLFARLSARTPMQWTAGRNAGFSAAPAERLVRPVVSGGPFGHERVNVEGQRHDPGSLLTWLQQAARVVRECPELGFGDWRILDSPEAPTLFVHRADWLGRVVVTVHNLAGTAATVRIELADCVGATMIDVFSDRAYEPVRADDAVVDVGPYGYRWLRAVPPDDVLLLR
jgi:maltose alpha-D-glucosyltransferase/alpha-amylase